MRPVGAQAEHVTEDGTTVLVEAGQKGWLHRVVVGSAGSAGTVTLQGHDGGSVIAVLDVSELQDPVFDLDLGYDGLEAVAADFAGSPDVTVIYEG